MWAAILNRFSLRTVLIINVIVPLLLAMAAATYFGLRAMEHLVEDRMQEDVQLVARAIRMQVSYSLEKERSGSLNQALQSVFHIGRVYGAYVYDTEGERIAAVGAVEPSRQQGDLREVVEGGKRQGQYEKIQGRRVYSYFVPLFDTSGKSNGLLQVTRRKSDFEDHIFRLRLMVAAILAGGGLFVSGFVLFGFHRAAGQYFKALAQSMTRVQEGDRSHRTPIEGPKEIAVLAKSLNSMLDSMDRSAKEVSQRREAQRILENKLRESEKMAAIGQLAAGVAHELGAPLSLIDGKAQRCLRDRNLNEVHGKSLQDIRHQVQRMDSIVRQLLDFGKGTMREKRWSRAAHLAHSAVRTIQKETANRVELLASGPEPGPFLYVDPLRLEQALINLLRNATQSTGITRVRLSWAIAANHAIIFRVDDDGAGIADEIKPRIFEPFFTMRNNSSNTGLGLAVVHGIIQEHGGSIQVYDGDLGGAGFQITLPPQKENGHPDQGDENA